MKDNDSGALVKNGGIVVFKPGKNGKLEYFKNFIERKLKIVKGIRQIH
jgi:hypothetical protein